MAGSVGAHDCACQNCAKPLSKPARGRNPKYCSAECRRRANGVRPIAEVNAERRRAALKTCKVCGNEFLRRNGDNVWDHCSKACANETRRRLVPVTEARREFARWADPNRILGYATRINALKLKIARKRTTCATCGTGITQPDVGFRRYCGKACKPVNEEAKRRHKRISKSMRRAKLREVPCEKVDPIAVFERCGWRCYICGAHTPRFLRGSCEDRAPELDHIIPISKGGPHTYANTACACRKCNNKKADRIIPELLVAA